MGWFRRKGKYWYFVERTSIGEKQYYIGDDKKVKEKLLPKKNQGPKAKKSL